MQKIIHNFVVDSDIIDEFFNAFNNKNPFTLKSEIKTFRKIYGKISDEEFNGLFANEISAAYKSVKPGDYIYHNSKRYRIAILKFRMKDGKSNAGKSAGWRIVSLVDEENDLFILLSIYKHSQGKDNLTDSEKNAVKALCDEYAEKAIKENNGGL